MHSRSLVILLVAIVMAAARVRAHEAASSGAGRLDEAIDRVPARQRGSMRFLLENMSDRDRMSLTIDDLVENVTLAHEALDAAPWRDAIPEDVFRNGVLPHASVTEPRERWRRAMRDRCAPLVAKALTPGEAALILNRELFPLLGVKYSTGRAHADQAPSESIEQGKASCTGLAILLIDACRSVAVPARFAGVPEWPDGSGNHSWVEVWDAGRWHFVGAAEPSDRLDDAWFAERATTCVRDDPKHAIYAVSFERTPIAFPLAWDDAVEWVHAVNVTDRYASAAPPLPPGRVRVEVRVVDGVTRRRVAAQVRVLDAAGELVLDETSRDERFDTNDHLGVALRSNRRYVIEATLGDSVVRRRLVARPGVVTLTLGAAHRASLPR